MPPVPGAHLLFFFSLRPYGLPGAPVASVAASQPETKAWGSSGWIGMRVNLCQHVPGFPTIFSNICQSDTMNNEPYHDCHDSKYLALTFFLHGQSCRWWHAFGMPWQRIDPSHFVIWGYMGMFLFAVMWEIILSQN